MKNSISKSPGQTIMEVIKSRSPHAFANWRAKDMSYTGKNLKFNVGRNEVLVLQSDNEMFNIKVKGKNKRGRVVTKKNMTNVIEASLVESIQECINESQ